MTSVAYALGRGAAGAVLWRWDDQSCMIGTAVIGGMLVSEAVSDNSPERRSRMDLNYSPEEEAFRDEVRVWLRENLPDDLRDKVVNYQELSKADLLRWHQILAKKGWEHEYHVYEGGHDGWYWGDHIWDYLPYYQRSFEKNGIPPIR